MKMHLIKLVTSSVGHDDEELMEEPVTAVKNRLLGLSGCKYAMCKLFQQISG